jgi:hypothetical protein
MKVEALWGDEFLALTRVCERRPLTYHRHLLPTASKGEEQGRSACTHARIYYWELRLRQIYIELKIEGTAQEIVDKYFEVETIYQAGRKLKADNEDF